MTEMVGYHHQRDGHKFEQAPGVGNEQGSLVCCNPWGCKKSDTTEKVNLLTDLFKDLQMCLTLDENYWFQIM